jgi:hypothetical protein
MAVVDRAIYDEADPQLNVTAGGGGETRKMRAVFAIDSGDSDASVYRLFQAPANAIVTALSVCNTDGMTGVTDVDFGLYHTVSNTANLSGATSVIDKDIFADGLSLVSIHALGAGQNALVSLPLSYSRKRLWELAGASGPGQESVYDIAMTGNILGLTGGTVVVDCELVIT